MDERWNLRVGRMSVGWEYGLDYDLFTQYLSAAYRLNVFGLGGNSPNFSLIPFANWGARLRWTPTENWKFQSSFMNGYPQDFAADDKHGLDFSFRPDRGAFYISEATYQWLATDEQRRGSDAMPGRVTVGGYFDTGEYDVLDGSGGTSQGVGSTYLIAQQKLWEPTPLSDRGLQLWGSTSYSWKRSLARFPWFVSGGLVWFGPTESRSRDRLALGVANAWLSELLPDQCRETVLSATYTIHVNDVLEVSPNVQSILRPGGRKATPDSLLLGLLVYLTL